LIVPTGDAAGVVVYMDPPYVGCTGYAADCARDDVLSLARRWHEAGAVVAISEAVPLDAELGQGWHRVRIDGERKGQSRSFSKQQTEWVTLNRAPAYVPGVQASLFREGK
jgi:16S rRNA G966 N2-methylase RsmD